MADNIIQESEAVKSDKEVEAEMYSKLNELLGSISGSPDDCCCEVCKKVDFDRCEDFKEVCIPVDMLNCQTRLLRVLVDIDNVCRNRLLAISVVLVRTGTNVIVSQKGNILFTGSSVSTCKHVTKEFCFTLPGNLCDNPSGIDIKVVTNYIFTSPLGSLPCDSSNCGC